MQKIKIAIINQSISEIKKVERTLENNEQIHITGKAFKLREGIELLESIVPDVILLDVNIAGEQDKTALETLLEKKQMPIIMLSNPTVKQMAKTVQAMANGAVDFIRKENGLNEMERQRYREELVAKIIHANNVKGASPLFNKDQERKKTQTDKPVLHLQRKMKIKNEMNNDSIIVIGTSTGGPRALQQIVEDLPKNFTTPILIVQHMPARFTKSLAVRLDNIGTIRVKEAAHGEEIKKGTAYIAPGNYHMEIKQHTKGLTIDLHQEIEYYGHRPSVNVLFESVANIKKIHKIAVVLTGMGKDGAEGVEKIKQSDQQAIIIAESKETAVIDGMPSATISSGYVTHITRLDEIANLLCDKSKR